MPSEYNVKVAMILDVPLKLSLGVQHNTSREIVSRARSPFIGCMLMFENLLVENGHSLNFVHLTFLHVLYFESFYLQANSRLTWRDMQHIVIQTANSEPLLHEDGWAFNGIGRKFSHKVSVFLEGFF